MWVPLLQFIGGIGLKNLPFVTIEMSEYPFLPNHELNVMHICGFCQVYPHRDWHQLTGTGGAIVAGYPGSLLTGLRLGAPWVRVVIIEFAFVAASFAPDGKGFGKRFVLLQVIHKDRKILIGFWFPGSGEQDVLRQGAVTPTTVFSVTPRVWFPPFLACISALFSYMGHSWFSGAVVWSLEGAHRCDVGMTPCVTVEPQLASIFARFSIHWVSLSQLGIWRYWTSLLDIQGFSQCDITGKRRRRSSLCSGLTISWGADGFTFEILSKLRRGQQLANQLGSLQSTLKKGLAEFSQKSYWDDLHIFHSISYQSKEILSWKLVHRVYLYALKCAKVCMA